VTSFTYGEPRSGYFNLGRLTTVTSPEDVVRIDYDAAGRATGQIRTLDAVDYAAEKAQVPRPKCCSRRGLRGLGPHHVGD
jgi:YD repeat-containing protein